MAASSVAITDPVRTLECGLTYQGATCAATTIPIAITGSGVGAVAALAVADRRIMFARTGTSGATNDGLFEYVYGATNYPVNQWAQLAGQGFTAGASAWAGVAGSAVFEQVYAAQTASGTGKLYRGFGQ